MLQVPVRAQLAVLASPIVAVQLLTSWQSYWHPLPHLMLQVEVDLHDARHASPQFAEQLVPEVQLYSQLVPHCAVQSAAPLQLGAQPTMPRQSYEQA